MLAEMCQFLGDLLEELPKRGQKILPTLARLFMSQCRVMHIIHGRTVRDFGYMKRRE